MNILTLEGFLRDYYNIDIYDFISYFDTTQNKPEEFIAWYKKNALALRVNSRDEKPIKISKEFIKKNIKTIDYLYFKKITPKEWIVKSFSFSSNVLDIKDARWYEIHYKWKALIDLALDTENYIITVFESSAKKNYKNKKNYKIKNLNI